MTSSKAWVGKVTVSGAKLGADVSDQTRSVDLSDTIDGVTQLTLVVNDPDLDVLATGLFAPKTKVVVYGQQLIVAALEVGPGDSGRGELTVECRPEAVETLKGKSGPKVFAQLDPAGATKAIASGVKVVAQAGKKRTNIAVNAATEGEPAETFWAAILRWFEEDGMVVFESNGTLYCGKPSWIVGQIPKGRPIVWDGPDTDDLILTLPTCRRTLDDSIEPVTVELQVHADLAELYHAGMSVAFSGVPGFDGDYWVSAVTGPLDNAQPWTISLAVPVDPKPTSESATEKTAGKPAAKKTTSKAKSERKTVIGKVAAVASAAAEKKAGKK
jgi:hypothetical protein